MPESLFDYSAHREGGEYRKSGRGTVVMFRHHKHQLVLKSYRRGGVPGRFVRETYFYTGVANTRMWQEFHLLQSLHQLGLPVPRPAAVRCVLMTPFTYRGELMMEAIPQARNLVDILCDEPMSEAAWNAVGTLIAQFHHHGLCHGDLNATNILQAKDGRLYLIDFGKSTLYCNKSTRTTRWQQGNLRRLQRSLEKCAGIFAKMHFTGNCWQQLIAGYDSSRQQLGEAAVAALPGIAAL